MKLKLFTFRTIYLPIVGYLLDLAIEHSPYSVFKSRVNVLAVAYRHVGSVIPMYEQFLAFLRSSVFVLL